MNILLISHEFSVTGAPNSLLRQAKYFRDAGHTVDVWGLRGGALKPRYIENGFIPIVIPNEFFAIKHAWKNRTKNYDFILCNTTVTYKAVDFLQRQNIPLVWFIRESKLIDDGIAENPDFREIFTKFYNLYTVSDYAGDVCRKYNPSVSVINNAIEDKFKKFKKTDKKIVFGYIGSIIPVKGVDVLINAFNKLSEQNKDIQLNIAGYCNHEYGKELQKRTVPQIKWLGEIQGVNKQKFFDSIDVLIVPSLDEASGLTVIEGTMQGKPVITTDKTGAKYLVSNGKSGFIVKSGDDTDLYESMSKILTCDIDKMMVESRNMYQKYGTTERERKEVLKMLQDNLQNYPVIKNNLLCPNTFKLFKKYSFESGRRHIYLCGLRVLSYTKGKNTLNTATLFTTLTGSAKCPIDIIVPVYNGFDFLDGLFKSILENTDLEYKLFVVNDASPDERVLPLLQKYSNIFGTRMCLINNPTNLGFLKSVNLALAKTTNHVVLINTDVVLPKKWASRLLYPIEKDPNVASVTPFSNCATIFSLPEFGDNDFDGDLESVNEALAHINAPFTKLHFPTGVGFCMAMNKDAITKVGLFDEIFERGYGEENDWCQRAIKCGFYNTISANLFVWHKHGASFGASKFEMIERHMKILTERYKNYHKSIKKIRHNKTYVSLREFSKLLFFNSIAKDTKVWLTNIPIGDTEIFIPNVSDFIQRDSLCIALQKADRSHVRISWYYNENSGTMIVKYKDINNILTVMKIKSVIADDPAIWITKANISNFISNM